MVSIISEPPGPKAKKAIEEDISVMSTVLKKDSPFVAIKGKGCELWDVDGNKYIDLTAGIGVCNTGHCHPKVVSAIQKQAGELIHISSDFYNLRQTEFAKRLIEITPGKFPKKVFLTNSGTESVECALKASRWTKRRPRLMAFIGAFHGRSMGSVSLTNSKVAQRRWLAPMLSEVSHMPYAYCYRCLFNTTPDKCSLDCLNYMRNAFKYYLPPEEIAAVFVEPIQGEGGYIVPPERWMKELKKMAEEYGWVFVADEVQSGFGRSGRMFAIEHFGIEPDMLTLAKAIGSGIPLGACVGREELLAWDVGSHGNTFGGNPIATAAAIATLDIMKEENLVQNAEKVGAFMMRRFGEMKEKHPIIGDLRGKGLMIGLELVKNQKTKEYAKEEAGEFIQLALKRGLVMLSAGYSAIRIAPPLVITQEQADTACTILDGIFTDIEKKFGIKK